MNRLPWNDPKRVARRRKILKWVAIIGGVIGLVFLIILIAK